MLWHIGVFTWNTFISLCRQLLISKRDISQNFFSYLELHCIRINLPAQFMRYTFHSMLRRSQTMHCLLISKSKTLWNFMYICKFKKKETTTTCITLQLSNCLNKTHLTQRHRKLRPNSLCAWFLTNLVLFCQGPIFKGTCKFTKKPSDRRFVYMS